MVTANISIYLQVSFPFAFWSFDRLVPIGLGGKCDLFQVAQRAIKQNTCHKKTHQTYLEFIMLFILYVLCSI